MKPKLLVLLPFKTFPAIMGGQKGSALFYQYLAQYFTIICVGRTENEGPYPPQLQVINIIKKRKLRFVDPFLFLRIRKIARKNSITHVIADHPYLGFHALLLKWFCGLKLIVHSHNIEGLTKKDIGKWWWRWLLRFEKMLHRKAAFSWFKTEEDREFAVTHFHLKKELTGIVPYGVELNTIPSADEQDKALKEIRSLHQLGDDELLFLFTGNLAYEPNYKAVKFICEEIDPVFAKKNIPYRILICGGGLPGELLPLADNSKNILFAGFVNDILLYYKGCHVFINPVSYGGGIKTKMIDALSCNLPVVSTVNGARGLSQEIVASSLIIVPDHDPQAFAEGMVQASRLKKIPSPEFIDMFSWESIAKKAAGQIGHIHS